MRTIGLIGGMSWESSAEYYRLLNVGVEQRLGGLHSARIVAHSVEFAEITALQEQDRWDEIGALLASAAQGLEAAGADFLVLGTTTFHRVADDIEAATGIPLLHLGDVLAAAAKARGLSTIGLIGTRFVMEQDFFKERFERQGISVVVPDEAGRARVHGIVYDELVHARVLDASRRAVTSISQTLWDAGAQGLVLGCTELELLVKQADTELPLFPGTPLHVAAALDRALDD